MEYVFWIAAVLVIYSYAIYPVILVILIKISCPKTPSYNNSIESFEWQDVAIIISAYNEEVDIINRLNNLAKIDYPSTNLNIYIGSDGSTDATNNLIKNYQLKNLKFFPFCERRGKASVLNELCDKAKEKILVFSDANTMFEPDVIKKLVFPFKDSSIGGVCGELLLHSSSEGSNQDSFYWKYEKFLKVNENKINGLLGANGAIYAIRKELYKPIPSNTIVDDFAIAMNIVLQKHRLIYESSAIAHEYIPDTIEHEFKRRVRIGIGNYQVFFRYLSFLNPATSITHFFTYLSHKVFRWFAPHLLLICLFTSILLADKPLYIILFILQLSIYLISLIALMFSWTHKLPKIISLLIFFVTMNVALLVGFFKYLSSNINPAWERTSR